MPESKLPLIGNATQLRKFLETELGYCTCALADAIPLLRDVLRLAKKRSESLPDIEEFERTSHALTDRLTLTSAPGLASWFVYGLDRADLVTHNYNVTDLWITDKGRALLDALESYPDPTLIEDEGQETVTGAEAGASADRPRD